MNHLLKSVAIAVAIIGGLTVSVTSTRAQSASATISGVEGSGGNYDYTITLDNTGTYDLNSFWYGWIQFEDDLSSAPSSAANSLGWNNDLDGNSIMWENSTGSALLPGQSATFTFVDSSTPTAITSGISGESVAYVGQIDFSQGSAEDSTGIFSPVLQSVPEPSTWSLLAFGMVAAAASVRFFAAQSRP
jgi:hypothetical protein